MCKIWEPPQWPALIRLPLQHWICSFTEETTFHTPKSSQMPRPSMPSLIKTSLFSSKLSAPDVASPLATPFGSSVVNRMAGIFDVNTCYGSPQSPQLTRRGPRLWTSASGEDYLFSKIWNVIVAENQAKLSPSWVFFFVGQQMTEYSNPSPSTSVSAEGKTVRQPNVIYSWIQNKREQVGWYGYRVYSYM